MRRLFGTDGIRGLAGAPPLDSATVSRVGRALVRCLRKPGDGPVSVVVGCDPRESSAGIVAALSGGIAAEGGSPVFAGVVPTPGVAYLARTLGADAGVVVSASHNPWRDNGIKLFSGAGRKLPDAVEAAVEREIAASHEAPPGRPEADPGLVQKYLDYLLGSVAHRLDGLSVVVDAANGAASGVAPEAFRRAGAKVRATNVSPDGRNINEGCGALHPAAMARAVVAAGADLGLALDGDADRVVMADGAGRLLDGDDVLYLWTLELEREGRKPDVVVGTVMSNFGLERALSDRGVTLLRAAVGDRYVVEEMERSGAVLGGEQSGHLIHAARSTTGDGTLTGLAIAALVAASGAPLAAQPRIERTPQVLRNVRVREKPPFDSIPHLVEEQRRAEELLAGSGRVLLRYSGTEALARVMVEGADRDLVDSLAASLARSLESAIGI
ncbi:MAG: phosphoglucosamine mutase [Acidobacteria bacterium]|nr:MAG: phosphoglucosamine mutase [Acidobacteriota bacterium]